jgi:hypothetical protein
MYFPFNYGYIWQHITCAATLRLHAVKKKGIYGPLKYYKKLSLLGFWWDFLGSIRVHGVDACIGFDVLITLFFTTSWEFYHTKLFKVKYLLLSNFMFHSIFLRVFYNYVPEKLW